MCWLLRYCAVAPTILAGQINPLLFEALYVSSLSVAVGNFLCSLNIFILYFFTSSYDYLQEIIPFIYRHIYMLLDFLYSILNFTFAGSSLHVWYMQSSAAGISACNILLCQSSTNMGKLQGKLWRETLFYLQGNCCLYCLIVYFSFSKHQSQNHVIVIPFFPPYFDEGPWSQIDPLPPSHQPLCLHYIGNPKKCP